MKIKHHQTSSARAFTLLELLVVIAIIGILASIAVPQFSEYRKRAFDSRALSDLRNAASAEEVYFMDYETYLSCQNEGCAELPGITRLSKGVLLNIQGGETGFTASASHPQGTGRNFQWDSENGGLMEDGPAN